MKIKSKVTNKEYDSAHGVIYILNMRQNMAYFANGGDECIVDVLYNKSKNAEKMCFVYEKCDKIKELYDKWCNHELEL